MKLIDVQNLAANFKQQTQLPCFVFEEFPNNPGLQTEAHKQPPFPSKPDIFSQASSVLVNHYVIEKQEIGFTKGSKSGLENG